MKKKTEKAPSAGHIAWAQPQVRQTVAPARLVGMFIQGTNNLLRVVAACTVGVGQLSMPSGNIKKLGLPLDYALNL